MRNIIKKSLRLLLIQPGIKNVYFYIWKVTFFKDRRNYYLEKESYTPPLFIQTLEKFLSIRFEVALPSADRTVTTILFNFQMTLRIIVESLTSF